MIVLLILVALAFDFMNGFHDAANSIATVVSTRVLPPRMAGPWAAFFNVVAAFGLGVAFAASDGHGTNDAQKTMGIIAVLLFTSGYLKTFYVPFWVILICHAAIALGTMFGGWRIVRTMGMRLTALQPLGGFCAETAGAIALLGSV